MKITAETPPNGDFVRYLEMIERASPAYQSVLAPHTPGAVVPSAAAAAWAERLRDAFIQRDDPVRPVPKKSEERPVVPWRPIPIRPTAVQGWAGTLLQRLERAITEAAIQKSRKS